MSNRLKLLVGIILVGALALFFWSRSKDASDPNDSSPSSKKADKNLERLKSARDSRLKEKQIRGSISGLVLDQENAPVAGARISIQPKTLEGMLGSAGESVEPLVLFSDKDGRFNVDNIVPAIYSATASAAQFIPNTKASLRVNPSEDTQITIVLSRGGVKLFGTIQDIGGGPIPQTIVQSHRWDGFKISTLMAAPASTVSDDNGEYELWLAPGSYSIDVTHADYVSSGETIMLPNQEHRLDFVMTPSAVVEGIVVSKSTGEPIANALVTSQDIDDEMPLKGVGLTGSVRSNDKGEFILRNLGNGSTQLFAIAKNAVSTSPTIVDLSVAETVTDVVLELDDAFTISGFVVQDDDDAEPLADVILGAFNFSPGVLIAATEPSDESGYFEIHGVSPGFYNVGAAGDDRVPNLLGTSVTVKDSNIEDVVVKIRKGYTLRGRIEPPGVAAISLSVNAEKIGLMDIINVVSAAIAKTTSNPDGTFTLHGVDSGSFDLVASTEDGTDGKIPVQVKGDLENLVIPLETRAKARGRVTDTQGNAVVGASVLYERDQTKKVSFSMDASSWRANQSITGPDGRYEIKGIKPGNYKVEVEEYELANALPKISIKDKENPSDLDIKVRAKSESIEGKVIGPDGQAVPDAWVSVVSSDKYSDSDENYALSDESGRFTIKNLAKGEYTLEAEGLRGSAKQKVENAQTGSLVTIRLANLGKVEGRVTNAQGPIETFTVRSIGPTNRKVSIVNAEGRFTLPKLNTGDYRIQVENRKGQGETSVTIKEGESVEVDITLGEFGSVYGQLVDGQTGEALAGYTVMAATRGSSSGGQAVADMLTGNLPKTDDDGRFRLGGIGIGKGRVVFFDSKKKGLEPTAMERFEIKAAEDLDLGVIKSTTPSKDENDENDENNSEKE